MNIKEITTKLNTDKRSVQHILSNKELCERILKEKPIKLKDLLEKSDVSRTFIMNCIKYNLISSFSNAPNAQGRTIYVFEDEVDEVSLIYSNNHSFNSLHKFTNSLLICAKGIIPEKDFTVLYEFFNGRKNFEKISDELGITRERTRQIFERGISNLSKRTYLINEVDNLEIKKNLLSKEVEFLTKTLDKIKKENEVVLLNNEIKDSLSKIDILSIRIEELDLSVRLFNCLKAAKVNTLMDVISLRAIDLLRFRNFGSKSILELEKLLDKHKLKLAR